MVKTVVSLTPVALDKDSRTLKMAASFSKFGMRSIVVEGDKSNIDFSKYGIETIFVGQDGQKKGNSVIDAPENISRKVLKLLWEKLKKFQCHFVLDLIGYLSFRKYFYSKFFLRVENKIPEAELYYLHSYEYFLAIEKKIKLNKANLVYDAHDFYVKINPDSKFYGSKFIKNFQKEIEAQAIKNANFTVTVSDGLREMYSNEFSSRPIVIRNAHNYALDSELKTSLKERVGLKSSDKITLIIGNRKKGQALYEVIKAFSKCAPKNNYLVFIGAGYEEIKYKISPTEQKRIILLSHVKPTEIVPLAKEADFGILPYFALTDNYKYALPNGFFQMIAAQLPIIFSEDLNEINKLNNEYSFGIATNFNSEVEFEKHLRYFFKNFSKRDVLKVKKVLNWDSEEKIFINMINKLIQ